MPRSLSLGFGARGPDATEDMIPVDTHLPDGSHLPAPVKAPAVNETTRRSGGGSSSGSSNSNKSDAPKVNYEQLAKAALPHLPAPLLKIVAQWWAKTGSMDIALAKMRESGLYDQYFPGNKRDDGSVQYDEATWRSVWEGFERQAAAYGLNPRLLRDEFIENFKLEVSVDEFAERLDLVHQGLVEGNDETRAYFQSHFGVDYDPAAFDQAPQTVFAMAISPRIGKQILQRRIREAQIGGEGLRAGFDRPLDRVQRLADRGLDRDGAREMFTAVAGQRPRLQTFASRYHDPLGASVDDVEEAVLGDEVRRRRFRRLGAAERSTLSPLGGTASDRSGGLIGLRQR